VKQAGAEAALVPHRGGHVHDGVLHRDAAEAAHGRVLDVQVQRPERAHEARGGVARRGREPQRRLVRPHHPHLQLLLEAVERVVGGGGGRRRGLDLELLHAGAQLGDVGGGVGQERRLVHPGHGRHDGAEVAEAAVELVPALPLGLHVADDGAVGAGQGPAAPPPRRSSSCRWRVPVQPAGGGAGGVSSLLVGLLVVLQLQVVVVEQPLLRDVAGEELEHRVAGGCAEEGGRRGERAATAGGGGTSALIHGRTARICMQYYLWPCPATVSRP
jgi:hypothetical protein